MRPRSRLNELAQPLLMVARAQIQVPSPAGCAGVRPVRRIARARSARASSSSASSLRSRSARSNCSSWLRRSLYALHRLAELQDFDLLAMELLP